MLFEKRYFVNFTEKETEADEGRALPTVISRVIRPAGIKIQEFCLPASCWAHCTSNSHTPTATKIFQHLMFPGLCQTISFFMKMNSIHPNLICLPYCPCFSLFVLSFIFSFHLLYAPESFVFLIHFYFSSVCPHAVREFCLFIPNNISFFFFPHFS